MFSQRPAVRPTSGSRENITRPGFFRDFVAIACSGWRRRIILGRLERIGTFDPVIEIELTPKFLNTIGKWARADWLLVGIEYR